MYRENLRKIEERKKLYSCFNETQHDFQEFRPHAGSVKLVCTKCAEESHAKTWMYSVYAYKGKRFA